MGFDNFECNFSLLTSFFVFFKQASGPVCDLVSTTLKINEEGFVDGVLDRKLYKQSEMPQVFKYDIIRKAYAQVT